MSKLLPSLLPENLSQGGKKDLRAFTFARIHLGKVGMGIPMKEVLALRAAHAAAKDAIFMPFESEKLQGQLEGIGLECIQVHSNAKDHATYLQRPDLGRSLAPESVELLQTRNEKETGVVLIVSGGLSATAVNQHAFPLLQGLIAKLKAANHQIAPIVLLEKGRVAASDPIGHYLAAKLSIILIGERPGLSSPDSMGAYLTYKPRIVLTDESRNCVSNIRPEGLAIPFAVDKLFYLIQQSLKKGLSGVGLKDEMGLID